MPDLGPNNPRHSSAAGAKSEAELLPVQERFKSLATIAEEMDKLYVFLRGARYANALNEAKQALQEKNYAKALSLVRDTGELHRRMHLQLLKQDPEKSGVGKKEVQKLRQKQEKLKAVLERFYELAEHLEKMAKVNPEKPAAPQATIPRPAAKPSPALRLSEEFRTKFQAAQGCQAMPQTID